MSRTQVTRAELDALLKTLTEQRQEALAAHVTGIAERCDALGGTLRTDDLPPGQWRLLDRLLQGDR